MDYISKSYIFIPFLSSRGLVDISKSLKNSSVWVPITESRGDGYNPNARYMLKYVADRINNDADNSTICMQKRFDAQHTDVHERYLKSDRKFIAVYPVKNKESSEFEYKKTHEFQFGGISLFCFDTGLSFLSVEIKYSEIDYMEISNILFNIKNIATPNIIEVAYIEDELNEDLVRENQFSLLTMAEEIINEQGQLSDFVFFEQTANRNFQRANIFTYIETVELSDKELNKNLFYLSHCYNSSFEYIEDTGDDFSVYKNNTVSTWGVTGESIVCVAFPQKSSTFVEDVFRKNINEGYQLMIVLMLNQKFKLYELLAETGKCLKGGEPDKMRKFRNDFYLFEQNFNFRIITEIPQYQNVYRLIYDAFSIDMLMMDVKEPLDAINSILDDEDNKQETENAKKTEKALAVISLFAIVSTLIDGWEFVDRVKPIFFRTQPMAGNIGQLVLSAVIIIAYFILAGGLIRTLFNFNKRKK